MLSEIILFVDFMVFQKRVPLPNQRKGRLKMKVGDASENIDTEMLLSYCDDLVRVFRDKTDINNLSQCLEYLKAARSTSKNDFSEVKSTIGDCQNKIDDCKRKIEEVKSSVVADEELQLLQNQLDEDLQRERVLREELEGIEEKINQLDQQRLSIEERNRSLKRLQEDADKVETKLSFYASVTNIIPDLQAQSKIAGNIVQRDKQVVTRFDVEDPTQADDHYDTCNSIWQMINL
ncbi:hypothetical protein Dimus_011422 [Dionaea muscipula]